MESRLFAVHDATREVIRIEEISNPLPGSKVFLGSSRPQVFGQDESLRASEMSLVQADATGQLHSVPASVRPVTEPEDSNEESTAETVVQSSSGGKDVTRKPDRNWFLNARIRAVLPRVRGRLLDIGCGTNELVRRYGNGVGVDRIHHGWKMGEKFDTVTLVAVLNYVPVESRELLLRECHDRLNKYGRLILTIAQPFTAFLHQRVSRNQPAGLSTKKVVDFVTSLGFRCVYHRPFMFGLNRVYVFSKEEVK